MSNYIVSARKYRPSRFADLIGQEHISGTLQNAIRTGQLAHSFLFCGPRGVGKTTAARILAKTINCENPTADTEACNQCPSCLAFNANSSFNIYELDAASNNSVEDIRSLVDQVRFPPQTGKFKIYIIDEVHMLSTSAFNAFLKTLEEPPSYCKFILATTEKHKILPTILSRCQVFDFRRMAIEAIVTHLRNICVAEKIEAEEDALHIIAQKCDGGMRDALSMFDRLASFSGGKLTYASVLENLNVLDYDYYFRLTDSLLVQDVPAIMAFFAEIQQKGFEGDDLILGLCEHFRNLLFAKNAETVKLMEVSDNLKQRYSEQANIASASFLLNCLNYGNQCDVQYKASKNKRLLVELSLLKMAYVNQLIDATEASKKKVADTSTSSVTETTIPTTQNPVTNKPSGTPVAAAPPAESPIVKKTSKVLRIDEIQNAEPKQEAQKIEEKTAETIEQKTTIPLTEMLLAEQWKRFIIEWQDKRISLANQMKLFEPKLADGKITLTVLSKVQQQVFEENSEFLKSSFMQVFGSEQVLGFEILLAENDSSAPKKYFTDKEQFQRLAELNPALIQLQKNLDLDFDR